jgi:predicted phage tail protein
VPPAQVTGLSVTQATDTQIDLAWDAASDAATYEVERSPAGQNTWAQIGTPATNSFSDTTVTTGTSYDYRVRAVDATGNQGVWSSVLTASALAPLSTFSVSPSATSIQEGSTVTWSMSTAQPDPGVLEIWQTDDQGSTVGLMATSASGTQPTVDVQYPDPAINGVYHVARFVRDADGAEQWSDESINNAPDQITVLRNGPVNVTTANNDTLTWSEGPVPQQVQMDDFGNLTWLEN